jgi:hypothetical protein
MTELAVATGSLGVQLQPFEKNRRQLLALPITIGSGVTAVLELFDKRDGPFTDADRRLVGAAADFAAALMKQALAERQTHGTLLGALESALHASQQVTAQIESTGDKPPPAVMAEMQRGLVQTPTGNIAADDVLQAAELLRVIAQRHGPQATKHCIDLLRTVDQMLAEQTKEI